MREQGKFEHLEHRLTNGEVKNVPLYVEPNQGLTSDSATLLEIADLIGTNLETLELSLEGLMDQVGTIMTDPDIKGLIVEDEYGGGSVRIDSEITQITLHGRGKREVPTHLVFDMLYSWSESSDEITAD